MRLLWNHCDPVVLSLCQPCKPFPLSGNTADPSPSQKEIRFFTVVMVHALPGKRLRRAIISAPTSTGLFPMRGVPYALAVLVK